MTIEAAGQPGLFPEPARIETKPTEPRWTVFEADEDDFDDEDDEDDETELIAVNEGNDLEQLRDDHDDYGDAWLRDNLTGRLYEPNEWPDDDAVDYAALHIINTLAANGFLAALADYEQKRTLALVAS